MKRYGWEDVKQIGFSKMFYVEGSRALDEYSDRRYVKRTRKHDSSLHNYQRRKFSRIRKTKHRNKKRGAEAMDSLGNLSTIEKMINKLDSWDTADAIETAVTMLIEQTECCGGYHGVKCPARNICKDENEATNRDECERNMLLAVLDEVLTSDEWEKMKKVV